MLLMLFASLAPIALSGQTVATPNITLASGAYVMPQSTTITDSTSGATIYWCYAATGTCTPATTYSGSIYMDPAESETICSYAKKSGYTQSSTVCNYYTTGTQTETPTISLASGTYVMPQNTTISDVTPGASIQWCYVTTGTCTPATSYAGSIYIDPSASETICASATASGYSASGATCNYYTAGTVSPAATPTISPASGPYTMPQNATITDSTSGASILWCYAVNTACTPATSYTGTIYMDPVAEETICAYATASGYSQSATACNTYTSGSATLASTPTASPAAGTYSGTQTVTLSTTPSGASIFYTLDGSTPDMTSTLYTGPITVSSTETIKAIATVEGGLPTPNSNYQTSVSTWKEADCASPGSSNCTSDDPGGDGVPTANSNPQGSPTGLITSGCINSGTTCMKLSQTPEPASSAPDGTDVLWPRTGDTSTTSATCDHCTWFVSDAHVYYPSSNGSGVHAYEHDQQDFDSTDELNLQFGMQCKYCDTSSAYWQIAGTHNVSWLSTGITQEFAQNTWHHIVKEDHWNLSELNGNGLCTDKSGNTYPCEYYTKLILDGTSYNLQDSSMCPDKDQVEGATPAGCTIPSYPLPSGWNSNISDQWQIDGQPVSSPSSLAAIVDEATFTAWYTPSSVASFAYTIN
jgi:hypothetical protein